MENPFSKENLSRYSVDKRGKKRNFTLNELNELFSGRHNIEKEILDYFRFKIHTGIRLEEFFRLNKNSFIEEPITTTSKTPAKCLVIDTAKGKGGKTSQRVIVMHKNIHDLFGYSWIKS